MDNKDIQKTDTEPMDLITDGMDGNDNEREQRQLGSQKSDVSEKLPTGNSVVDPSKDAGNPFAAVIDRNPEASGSGSGSQRVLDIRPDDFVNTLIGFGNMILAHEISVNPDYKLERFSPPPGSIEYKIKQQMKRAFWDVVEEQLNLVPPNYVQALSIFEEIKTMLLSLLMPHHHTLRSRIDEILDLDLIRQQVQNDALEFPRYAEFLIETLSQLCAPSRDEEVASLQQLSTPVEIFRRILEVMENMKLDMANFYIQQFRPTVVQNCIQYERKKFSDFLELEYRMEEDGLRNTRQWLLRSKLQSQDGNGNTTICKAFSEVLLRAHKYDPNEWPETLALDAARFSKIANTIKRLGIQGAIILTSESLSQTVLGKPFPELRNMLKIQLESLISEEDVANDENLKESLERVAEQVIKLIGDILITQPNPTFEETAKESIRQAVKDLIKEDNKIRNLLVRRSVEFAESWTMAGKAVPQVPNGLNCIGAEVLAAVKNFFTVVQFNRAVFDCVYVIIVEEDSTNPESLSQWQYVEASQKKIINVLSANDNVP